MVNKIRKIISLSCLLSMSVLVGFDYRLLDETILSNSIYDEKNIILSVADNMEDTKKEEGILLVNKSQGVGRGYIPQDLVTVNVPGIREVKLCKEAAIKLEALFDKSKKDGVNLLAVSGYRDYNYQETLYNNSVQANGKEHADKYVALPGYSEHQTGLAIDVFSKGDIDLTEEFENSPEFKWLEENMYDFGFILRYPKGKEDITGYGYEPWHLRYVGVEVAKEIKRVDITLEEYVIEYKPNMTAPLAMIN